jgi:hypothetical protein
MNRFIESLPEKVRSTSNWEDGTKFRTKRNALKDKYIEHNQLYKKYIPVDIDREQSAYAFEELNLPIPTIITINPDNTHCHYLYELNTPVIYTENGRRKPQQFYESVDIAITKALNGDTAYVGKFTKNPLHKCWKVINNNISYDLEDFQEYLDLTPERKKQDNIAFDYEGRNSTIFNNLRFWAYVEVKSHNTFASFMQSVEIKAISINDEFYILQAGKLAFKEVFTIAMSVGKWTWKHRYSIGNCTNRGCMQLPESMALKQKQSLSAERTNDVKKKSSFDLIFDSATALKTKGSIVTKNSVALHSGLSFDTVKRHWKKLEENINTYGR